MVGKTLAHYTILEKLGAGGMGEVFAAEDTRLNRRVALKVLNSDTADDPAFLRRFVREAKAVASLNHPNIVTIYSVEEATISDPETGSSSAGDDEPDEPRTLHFITMELVDGHALDEEIPDKGMSLDRFFGIAIPLADALASAHASGIVHRDLKPANIMIGQDGRLKILDFGLAKLRRDAEGGLDEVTQALTQEGSILGTIPYMAPEQLQGRDADHRSDIFSLGIVLYEMATGDRPFRGNSQVDVISSILRDSPQPPSDINRAFPLHIERILTRALEKDPDDRFQSAKDIKEALYKLQLEMDAKGTARFEALDEEAIAERQEAKEKAAVKTTGAAARATERPRWLVPALAGGGALVLVLLALLFVGSGGSAPETQDAAISPAPDIPTAEAEGLQAADGSVPTEDPAASVAGSSVGGPLIARRTESTVRPGATVYPGDAAMGARIDESFASSIVSESRASRPRRPAPSAPTQPRPAGGAVQSSTTEVESAVPDVPEEEEPVVTDVQLRIELATDIGRGALTVYADSAQIFQEEFRFVERSKILRRAKDISGELSGSATVPAGTEQLRVYLAPRNMDTQVLTLDADFQGDEAALRIHLTEDGNATAALE